MNTSSRRSTIAACVSSMIALGGCDSALAAPAGLGAAGDPFVHDAGQIEADAGQPGSAAGHSIGEEIDDAVATLGGTVTSAGSLLTARPFDNGNPSGGGLAGLLRFSDNDYPSSNLLAPLTGIFTALPDALRSGLSSSSGDGDDSSLTHAIRSLTGQPRDIGDLAGAAGSPLVPLNTMFNSIAGTLTHALSGATGSGGNPLAPVNAAVSSLSGALGVNPNAGAAGSGGAATNLLAPITGLVNGLTASLKGALSGPTGDAPRSAPGNVEGRKSMRQ